MSIKILSVDDETDLELLLTQYFRRKIRNGEYEFFFAHNGLEALQVLLKHPDISIILSDINMPEMDGLTLLAKINEMRIPSLKCIMVSAYGDMDNIRQAMNGGAFDFATKPIDLDDLQRTIDKAVDQIEYIRSAQKEHAQLVDIQTDLSVAREIQHAILPRTFDLKLQDADKVNIYASMLAAKDVGGDFYDFFPIDDHRMGFTIADVSGKGVPAAIFMAVSRTLIKATGLQDKPTNECMSTVNDILCDESVGSMFVTVFYGIYDLQTGQITFTNAGHNPPYILKADGQVEVVKSPCNLVLGAVPDMPFSCDTLKLDPGDTLYMFTDGVTEAENKNHDQFGESRLEEALAECKGTDSKHIVDTVNAKVKEFINGAAQSDDITQLVIRRK
ncbi:MAG: response regulator [Bacteroidales bacterium]|jgi:sigma-B regulation protein RsbU (phosphoserine phosphatase)|nr:response regulator [Bacteroidales bacterium]